MSKDPGGDAGRGGRLIFRKLFNLYALPAMGVGAVMWLVQTKAPSPIILGALLWLGWPILGLARIEGRREERRRLTGREVP